MPHWSKFQDHRQCPSKIIELEPRPPFKMCGFSGQILIKLRLYVNFSHRIARVNKLWSHDHIYNIIFHLIKFCWWRHGEKLGWNNLYFKIPLFSEGLEYPFLLISPKLEPCLFKQSLKTRNKLNELQIRYQNTIYICLFCIANFQISGKKMLMPAEIKRCVTWFIYHLNLL